MDPRLRRQCLTKLRFWLDVRAAVEAAEAFVETAVPQNGDAEGFQAALGKMRQAVNEEIARGVETLFGFLDAQDPTYMEASAKKAEEVFESSGGAFGPVREFLRVWGTNRMSWTREHPREKGEEEGKG